MYVYYYTRIYKHDLRRIGTCRYLLPSTYYALHYNIIVSTLKIKINS